MHHTSGSPEFKPPEQAEAAFEGLLAAVTESSGTDEVWGVRDFSISSSICFIFFSVSSTALCTAFLFGQVSFSSLNQMAEFSPEVQNIEACA